MVKALDKAIRTIDSKFYKVVKINAKTGKENNLGQMSESEMKSATRGYKFNGMFYSKEGSNVMFMVEEVN